MRYPLLLGLLLLCLSCASRGPVAAPAPWIAESDRIATEYAKGSADRYPETASSIGFREYDGRAMRLEDDMETPDRAYLEKWIARLEGELTRARDPNVRLDFEVLLDTLRIRLRGQEIDEKAGDIPFYAATRYVYQSLAQLVNAQSSSERKRAAVDRFRAYVEGTRSLLPAFQSRVLYREKLHPKTQLQPLRQEVAQYLEESADYLKGIEELLTQSGRDDWRAAFARFRYQVATYDRFVKTHVLPRARRDARLPREVYAHILRVRGIDTTPEELIRMALADYQTTYARYRELAGVLAKKHGLTRNDPVSVMKFLKSQAVVRQTEVEKLYRDADAQLAKIIRDHDLVSLPAAPLRIRFAGDAESKANPVPHLKDPPLIGNRGERPEFVVPTSSSGTPPFDDFSFAAAAPVLTAHEGRPGHDLQFSSMLDNGVSVIRARYAFNNVNVEGWGLYAEDMVFPYLSPESQFTAHQTRLWRIARAFLDPQLQLGQIPAKRVREVFVDELGVSELMAGLELKRYTFESPGQAPSYYWGLKKILAGKAKLKVQLGERFRERCFHDGLLSMGLLPIDLAMKRLSETLRCD